MLTNLYHNAGYNEAGASTTKNSMRGFNAESLSPHSDIDLANLTLRQRSRVLYMSTPAATGALKTSRTNVIGQGLRFKAAIDYEALGISEEEAKKWQSDTEREFNLWAEDKRNCDATGVNDFYGMQQLAYISSLMSGDVFVMFTHDKKSKMRPYDLRLHLVEADRVSTPTQGYVTHYPIEQLPNGGFIYDGVEVDAKGAVVAYHVCNRYPTEQILLGKEYWTRIPVNGKHTDLPNILQITVTERPEQYRGVPLLAQIIEVALQGRRYTEAELKAAVVQSFITAFITTEADPTRNPLNEVRQDGLVQSSPNDYQMGPGQINIMKPGEGVNVVSPTHPTTGYVDFINAIVRQMGAAMEIPGEVLLKKYDSSYSAARAANNEAQKSFKMYRGWFVNDFCKPVYERWLTEAIAGGRVKAPGFFTDPIKRKAWLGSEWIGPGSGMLDPMKEIQAMLLACGSGLMSYEQAAVELNGSDFWYNTGRLLLEAQALADINKVKTPFEPEDNKETDEDEQVLDDKSADGGDSGGTDSVR